MFWVSIEMDRHLVLASMKRLLNEYEYVLKKKIFLFYILFRKTFTPNISWCFGCFMFKIGQQIVTRRVRIKVICKNGVKPVYLSDKKLDLYKLTSRIFFCHLNMKQRIL